MALLTNDLKFSAFDTVSFLGTTVLVPLNGGVLYSYEAGTTTPKPVYANTGTTPTTNPVVLNARGEATFYLGEGAYKFELKRANGTQVWIVDNVVSMAELLRQAKAYADVFKTAIALDSGAGLIGFNAGLVYPANTVGLELAHRLPVELTIAALRARSVSLKPGYAMVTGYYTSGDGGGGLYVLDTNDATTTDNGGTVIVGADGGRWKLNTTEVSLEQFGAKGDSTTDDTAFIAKALASGLDVHGHFGKTYKFTSGLQFNVAGQTIDLHGAWFKPVGVFSAITLGASVLTLRNFTMDQTALNGIGIHAPAAQQQIVIEDVQLENGTDGMHLIDCYTSWFIRLKINFCSDSPMVLKSAIVGTATNSMWFRDCSFNGHSTTGDVILLQGAVGIFLDGCNFQTNGSSNNEIRIQPNVNAGCAHISIENCYFEDFGHNGNSVYIGDPAGGSNQCGSIKIYNNYFQTSKRPVKVGALVTNDLEVIGNTFQFVTGLSGYAMEVPAGFVPNCHSNTGSLGDIDRTIVPQVKFGGNSTGMVYVSMTAKGNYQRVGNRVTGEFAFQLSSKGTSNGAVTITGLPVASSPQSFVNSAQCTIYENLTGLTGPIFGGVLSNTSAITLWLGGASSNIALTDANFTNTASIFGVFSYEVA